MKSIRWIKQRSNLQIVAITIVIALALGTGLGLAQYRSERNQNTSTYAQSGTLTSHENEYMANTPEAGVLTSTSDQTKDNVLFLIEEEKLAHDVYLKMYQLYGSKVFSNIASSETQHQNLVASVLDARSIPDPRTSTVGVFTDTDLQKLYDDLVAKGSISLTEAYKVGVVIEEMDIADLKKDLAALDPVQTDIETTMQSLLRGSENHLRAFSRKLG